MATQLLERIRSHDFVVSIQVDPPCIDSQGPISSLDVATDKFGLLVAQLKNGGAQLLDINSSSGKKKRIFLDSLYLAGLVRSTGLDVIPHVTTRDTSMAGLLNNVASAYAVGDVENFLMITGDPHDIDHEFPSSGVYEVDAIGALENFAKHLPFREKIVLAAAVNQNNPEKEGERILRKQGAGVDFFMSQPVFSAPQAERLLELYFHYSSLPLLVGVWPLVSRKTAEAIRKGVVEGVVIDEALFREAMRNPNDDGMAMWGIDRTCQLVRFLKDTGRVAGVYVVAPSRNPLLSLEILNQI